jgi:large subunit ribosomal protein L28
MRTAGIFFIYGKNVDLVRKICMFALSYSRRLDMSKRCQLTGTTVLYGNNVSHANNKTRRRFLPNVQNKRIWDDEKKVWVRMKVSTRALKTLSKRSLQSMLKESMA